MFGRIGHEFQCLERSEKNWNVYKDKARIPMFLERYGQNSIVWKDKKRIPMFGKIRPEFQCLE